MKKFKGVWGLLLTAFVLAFMVAPVNAQIVQSPNGVGDALIFPYLDADLGSTYVITNESNLWMQVHVRIRTGGQSVEGRDFPLILSPGDMAVFGVVRAAGQELWTIDYTMDENNFKYVRVDTSAKAKSLYDLLSAVDAGDGLPGNINRFELLEPTTKWPEAQKLVDKQYGYVEVIGEAVFVDGLDKEALLRLKDATPTQPVGPTNTVREIARGNRLADVPNVLSGKAYIGAGMAYNATAFADFRTNDATVSHRVENYLAADGTVIDSAVIVTSENAFVNDLAADDYTYHYDEDRTRGTDGGHYEAMVSANNSWGPTLADGDSYLADDLDAAWDVPNSVREVEAVLLKQSVRGHYLAGATNTHLVVMFPTKHHIANVKADYLNTQSEDQWRFVYNSLATAIRPTYDGEIWDLDEHFKAITIHDPDFQISPRPPVTVVPPTVLEWPYEVNVFDTESASDLGVFSAGRFVFKAFKDQGVGRGLVQGGQLPLLGLSYTVDANGAAANMTSTQY